MLRTAECLAGRSLHGHWRALPGLGLRAARVRSWPRDAICRLNFLSDSALWDLMASRPLSSSVCGLTSHASRDRLRGAPAKPPPGNVAAASESAGLGSGPAAALSQAATTGEVSSVHLGLLEGWELAVVRCTGQGPRSHRTGRMCLSLSPSVCL